LPKALLQENLRYGDQRCHARAQRTRRNAARPPGAPASLRGSFPVSRWWQTRPPQRLQRGRANAPQGGCTLPGGGAGGEGVCAAAKEVLRGSAHGGAAVRPTARLPPLAAMPPVRAPGAHAFSVTRHRGRGGRAGGRYVHAAASLRDGSASLQRLAAVKEKAF